MAGYIDASLEALQEDEELIEAVNELVDKVSGMAKAEIESEVSEFVALCKRLMEHLFPIVFLYQQEPARIKEDVQHLAIFFALLLAAVWVLAPAKRRGTHDTNNLKKQKQKRTGWLLFRTSKDSNCSLVANDGDDSESDKLLPYRSSTDDETDEQRFETNWPISIVNSGYSKLALPPSCRLIRDGGKRNLNHSVPKKKQLTPKTSNTGSRENKNSSTDSSTTTPSMNNNSGSGDDDNPVARMQNYVRHLWFFIRSLISYDYTTAGKTLITWLQGLQRIHHYRRTAAEVDSSNNNNNNTSNNTSDAADNDTSTVDGSVDGFKVHYDDEKKEDTATTPNSDFHIGFHEADDENSFAEDISSRSRLDDDGKRNSALTPTLSESSQTAHAGPCIIPLQDSLDVASTARAPLHQDDDNIPAQPLIKSRPLLTNGRHQSDGSVYFDPPAGESSCEDDDHILFVQSSPKVTLQQRRRQSTTDYMDGYARQNSSDEATDPWLTRADDGPDLNMLQRQRSPTADSDRHFFDTANSRDSLEKMSVDVPVPDKNGYILGDAFLPDSTRYTPLLVFVNSRSGPQQGHLLITQLRRLLNPIQVWDLADGGPKPVLESFLVLSRLRLLVCGGDGTVSWIINTLEEMKINRRQYPPIAILPLGTGNDLARIHGWGGGYNNESLITILEQISESYSSLLDRWEVTIQEKKKSKKKKEVKGFFNYLGVGADAQAALQVHYLRESRPEWFFSRIINKAMYGIFGAEDIIKATTVNVRREIKLIADGVEVPLPPDSQGIILLNIDAYAGGVPLWSHGVNVNFPSVPLLHSTRRARSMTEFDQMNLPGRMDSLDRVDSVDDLQNTMSAEERFARVTACDMPSSCQDGFLDVVSIRGAFHLGQIKVGLSNAQRLCQCREATITIKNKMAVQVDGEPWRQNPCTLTIKRKKDPAVMLHRSADDGGVETEMSKLLDWAEARNMIDSQVHTILMKEFSRRIESKTRKRRVRQQDNIMSTLKKAMSSGAMATSLSGSSHNAWQGGGGIAF